MVTLETKSFVGEFFDLLRDIFFRQTITLNRFEYIHVQDRETGTVTLHEGPVKLRLRTHHHILGGIREKVRVSDGQFAVILNPFDPARGDVRVITVDRKRGELSHAATVVSQSSELGDATLAAYQGASPEHGKQAYFSGR